MKNHLQEVRWKKGWSQQQLSNYSGVSISTISKIENGETKNPAIDIAYKLCKSLDCNIWDLFTELDD